jgi:glycosyltransferase involved in cell wall biosynthesis
MKPLVSIVIPCYNAEKWIAATIESALAQRDTELEVIVVNDGSKDGSLNVANQFAGPRVQVIDQPNQGASAARNAGLRLAKGDFIQFLDADDLLEPSKISNQLPLLAQNRDSVATARWARFTGGPDSAVVTPSPLFRDLRPLEYLQCNLANGEMMHPAAWLVPTAIARAAGPWNEELTLNDDGEYFSRVVLASQSLVHAPGALSLYRSGLAGSLSGRSDRRALESLFKSCVLIADHAQSAAGSGFLSQALADYFQRLAFELYPDASDLSLKAEQLAAAWGGSSKKPSMGMRQAVVARLFGWRMARRLSRFSMK